jgi:hypothetical protein
MSEDKSIIEKISETASNMYNTAAEKVRIRLSVPLPALRCTAGGEGESLDALFGR